MKAETDIRISEREFMQNEFAKLRQLSEDIENALIDFNTDCTAIANACHLDPRIVRRARRCIRVNGDCERRIRFYLMKMYGE